MSKELGKHFVVCTKPKPLETSYLFEGGSSPSKCKKGRTCFVHINMVKVLTDQLRSIEVKIEDESMYMVLFMRLPSSFDNLVTSLDSMPTKDADF
jgi:hypothetical protein